MHLLTKIKRLFITSFPVKFVIRKSKHIRLPGFEGIALFDVVNFFFQQAQKTSFTERASSIAYNIFMAIPPAIIFLFTLIPFFPISHEFTGQVFQLIRDIMPGEKNYMPVISFLEDFINNPRSGLLSLGFILAMFFSSNAVIGIMRSFNKDYIGFRKRNSFQKRFVALKLTAILFILIIVCIIVLVSQEKVLEWLGVENKTLRTILINLRWVFILLLFWGIISFIYRQAPAVHQKWKFITPGSILATFLMILFIALFSFWVTSFSNYNKLYGSIGTILILMLLIYFNSLVLLIGFELNVSISSLKRISENRQNEEKVKK